MRAIRVEQFGGPDVMQVVDTDTPTPGPGQLLVDVEGCGVNFMDIYQRSGTYKIPLPYIPGSEGAGTVKAVGEGVTEFSPGDKVGWLAPGSYAEQAAVPAARAVKLPSAVPTDTAAAGLLQGMTAQYLVRSTYAVQPGDTVLVHAGAGGVGLLLTQIVKLIGGRVITTVSTAEKEALSRAAGADEVIRYDQVEFAPEVRRLTGGEGVPVVYDGVGQATFEGSLASLRPRGLLALFGASSGQVPPFDVQRLNPAGSLYVTRPTMVHYTLTREELLGRAGEVLGWIESGQLDVRIGGRYPLVGAGQAHDDLANRRSTGKLLLVP